MADPGRCEYDSESRRAADPHGRLAIDVDLGPSNVVELDGYGDIRSAKGSTRLVVAADLPDAASATAHAFNRAGQLLVADAERPPAPQAKRCHQHRQRCERQRAAATATASIPARAAAGSHQNRRTRVARFIEHA